ncbi:hypothetical protein OG588_16595 [Streptomyces prunicolor]|uniref:hypothetical protein n=1 Tax=Streptomyces prunicolor TaxID=67348 RepID=UPI00386D3F87|nr:hypothetical protein OG588_16595 [Streptomyces prunicolor]
MLAALCAIAAVLLLSACGTQLAGGMDGATPTGSLPWTLASPSRVTGAQLADDQRTLTVSVRVPDGKQPCIRALKAAVTASENNTVWVQITFSSPSDDRRSGCTGERTASTRVRLPAPLGKQRLVVDYDNQFTTDGAKLPALRLCGELGCHPPATGCTTASYEQAEIAADVPAHTYRDAEHCDGKWLVLDFSWRTGPVCGDTTASPAGCASRLGDRWFFRAKPAGWAPITSSAAGGCKVVQRAEPAFPASLCAGLAPLSASLHPSYPPASPSTSASASASVSASPTRSQLP